MGDAFTCKICHCIFQTRAELDTHKDVLHRKKHQCPACIRTFPLESKLKRHFRSVHSNERPYVCDKCSKGFARKDKLNDHMRCHNKSLKFQCNFCESNFVMRSHLNNHLRTIHDVKILRANVHDFSDNLNNENSMISSGHGSSGLFNQEEIKRFLSVSQTYPSNGNNNNNFCDSQINSNNSLLLNNNSLFGGGNDAFSSLQMPQLLPIDQQLPLPTQQNLQPPDIASDIFSLRDITNHMVSSEKKPTNSYSLNNMALPHHSTSLSNGFQSENISRYTTDSHNFNLNNENSSNWLNSLYYLAGNALCQQQQQMDQRSNNSTHRDVNNHSSSSTSPSDIPEFPGLAAYLPRNDTPVSSSIIRESSPRRERKTKPPMKQPNFPARLDTDSMVAAPTTLHNNYDCLEDKENNVPVQKHQYMKPPVSNIYAQESFAYESTMGLANPQAQHQDQFPFIKLENFA